MTRPVNRVLGAVLAGGASTRFGSDKALALWCGKRLIDHALDALRPQAEAVIVVGRDLPGAMSIPDRPASGLGPLGGLCAALHFGAKHGFDVVVTTGCDLPDLPGDLALRLGTGPVVARGQPLLGVWPCGLAPVLDAHLAAGRRSLWGWADSAGARVVDLGDVPNVNHPSDLAALGDTGLSALDRPVWSSLTGRQAHLAVGDHQARRFAPQYGPFAAAADRTMSAALADLAGDGELWLVEKDEVAVPPGLALVRRADCLQMIAAAPVAAPPDRAIVELGDADAAEMIALARLTEPGPFAAATHRLGGFIGIREGGRLVAMAGERMKPGRFTEVSGVCTHPDHRGQGYAAALIPVVVHRILARGETPFLHSYASNAKAIVLYESLGFRAHQRVTATVLRRDDPAA